MRCPRATCESADDALTELLEAADVVELIELVDRGDAALKVMASIYLRTRLRCLDSNKAVEIVGRPVW